MQAAKESGLLGGVYAFDLVADRIHLRAISVVVGMMIYIAFVWSTLAFFEAEDAPLKELYFSDLPVATTNFAECNASAPGAGAAQSLASTAPCVPGLSQIRQPSLFVRDIAHNGRAGVKLDVTVTSVQMSSVVNTRAQQIGGSGGSLEPPGPLLEPPGPLLTHFHTIYIAHSERLPTRLNPLAERACFSQVNTLDCDWDTLAAHGIHSHGPLSH
jgi:hypothetical protein